MFLQHTDSFALLVSVQVITYFAGRIYDPNEGEERRLTLAGDYLKGDASLMIRDLLHTDSGEYSCKVKNGGKYNWNTVDLIVLSEYLWTRYRLTFNSSTAPSHIFRAEILFHCLGVDGKSNCHKKFCYLQYFYI